MINVRLHEVCTKNFKVSYIIEADILFLWSAEKNYENFSNLSFFKDGQEVGSVTSKIGSFGSWRTPHMCSSGFNNFLDSIQFKSERVRENLLVSFLLIEVTWIFLSDHQNPMYQNLNDNLKWESMPFFSRILAFVTYATIKVNN